jgi:hypothetical protein
VTTDLFTDRPPRNPLAVAHTRVVTLGGRSELRLLLLEDEYGDRRIMLGRGWLDDPVFGPTLTVPVEAVPALREALASLSGEA